MLNIMNSILPFNKIPISTISFIMYTNLEIDIPKAFHYFCIDPTKYEKNNKKKKVKLYNYEPGSVLYVNYGNQSRGTHYKVKRRKTSNKIVKKTKYNYFLHTLQLIMTLDNNKIVGVKIPRTGNFHITGAKSTDQFYTCFEYIFSALKKCEEISGEKIIYIKNILGDGKSELLNEKSKIHIRFQIIMTNIVSEIGYKINRQEIDTFLNNETDEFTSEYRPDKTPSVKIKIRIPKEINYRPDLIEVFYDFLGNHSAPKLIPYSVIFNDLNDDLKKKVSKQKFFSYLLFSSGKFILSGLGHYLKDSYEKFMNIAVTKRKEFEETYNVT